MREALTLMGVLLLGLLLGAALMFAAFRWSLRAFGRVAQGLPPDLSASEKRPSGPRSTGEDVAKARAMKDAIDVGTQQLLEQARAAGVHLTERDARAEARRMIVSSPLGGAQ